jgi:hypothetical protein
VWYSIASAGLEGHSRDTRHVPVTAEGAVTGLGIRHLPPAEHREMTVGRLCPMARHPDFVASGDTQSQIHLAPLWVR